MINAGSFSRIQVYESCPKRAEIAYVQRIPEPERPPLPDGKEYPNDRGTRVHDEAEEFVRGTRDVLSPELLNFEEELTLLRDIYASDPSRLVMEDMWTFNDTWDVCPPDDYKQIWMRIKLDVCLFSADRYRAYVIDYKTGKRYGNEIKHAEQTQLYGLATALRYPDVQEIVTELWYTDQDEIAQMEFTREQALRFLKNWNNKMLRMTGATEFPAKPNMYSCRYCPYKEGLIGKFGPEGTGDCSLNPV